MYHLIILFKIYLPGRGQKEHVSLLIDWVSLKQMISKNIQKKKRQIVWVMFLLLFSMSCLIKHRLEVFRAFNHGLFFPK